MTQPLLSFYLNSTFQMFLIHIISLLQIVFYPLMLTNQMSCENKAELRMKIPLKRKKPICDILKNIADLQCQIAKIMPICNVCPFKI